MTERWRGYCESLRMSGLLYFLLPCRLRFNAQALRQESFAQTDSRVLRSKETSVGQERGKISGRVIAAGKYQNPKPLPVFKNRSFCGTRLPNETLLVGRDGGLRNAVVTLHPIDRSAGVRPLQVALDNKRCAFAPHVQVAGVGSELVLKNSDPILHTVHARLATRRFSTLACQPGDKSPNGWNESASSELTVMCCTHG